MRYRMILAGLLAWACGSGAAFAQPRTEIHFPDPTGYQTLKCDLHMHTVFSDGLVWPTVRVDEAWREGLDVIAITDHIEYQPHWKDIPTNHNRSYELAEEKARSRNILLIHGAEVTRDTPPGHHNAIFLSDVDPLNTADFFEVFRQAGKQDAFVFWNHPGWKGPERGKWDTHQAKLLEDGLLHGIEVCNGEDYYPDAHRWALEKNLTMLGNSDIHVPSPFAQRTPTNHRTLNLVFVTKRTVAGVKEALHARRTAVWYQNQLIGREKPLADMFAACVKVEPPHHRSGDSARVRIHNRCELDLELRRIGEKGPEKIKLPARTTSLVKVKLTDDDSAEGWPYRVTNLLVAPGESLKVNLRIPAE